MSRPVYLLLLSALLCAGQTVVDADHAHIRYTGRVDFTNPKRPRFDWPGVQVTARFQGTSVAVVLDCSNSQVGVYVDGDSVAHVSGGSGLQTIPVAQGLADTEHDLLIVKRNEGEAVTFGGLVLDNGRQPVALPPRAPYRVEFIGDSYVACYGCVSRTTTCTDLGTATNAYHSFAAVSARDAGAEYSLVAASGRGLLHNSGDPALVSASNMQVMFSRALRSSATPVWDSLSWVPQLVVVALGINDLRDDLVTVTQETFTQHYRQFIARIQNSYPGAHVLCLAFNWPDTLPAYVQHVYDTERGAGNTKVHYLHVTAGNAMGCDFHPNVGGHWAMAQQVTPVIQSILGLTRVRGAHASAPGRALEPPRATWRAGVPAGMRVFDMRGRRLRTRTRVSSGIVVRAEKPGTD